MPNYVTTINDKTGNQLYPRTKLTAIADEDGNYIPSDVKAGDIYALRDGKVQSLDADATGTRGTSSAYSNSATYAVGSYAIYNNVLYRCKTAVTTPEAFNAAKWEAVDLTTLDGALRTLIDSGSNYLRLSDGTQICWGKEAFAVGNMSEGTESSTYTVTYPMPFTSAPSVTITPQGYAGNYYSVGISDTSSLMALRYGIKANHAFGGGTTYQSWIAIGRWG